jgi:demethoxyubiquinone hydroxylase (CLK1/Coq7/Cat5 family)
MGLLLERSYRPSLVRQAKVFWAIPGVFLGAVALRITPRNSSSPRFAVETENLAIGAPDPRLDGR